MTDSMDARAPTEVAPPRDARAAKRRILGRRGPAGARSAIRCGIDPVQLYVSNRGCAASTCRTRTLSVVFGRSLPSGPVMAERVDHVVSLVTTALRR